MPQYSYNTQLSNVSKYITYNNTQNVYVSSRQSPINILFT